MAIKPIWTEGLLVSQHHFQVQDQYHEALLRERIASVRRFHWGILEVEIDPRLFQAGQFGLRTLRAAWPDGMIAMCGGASGDPLPEPRPFEGHFAPNAVELDVFVAVTIEDGAANVASPGEPAMQRRFSRVARTVDDFNAGGQSQEVDLAVPNLRILFGTERRERLATLPVAQLVRQSSGQIIVRDTFVPPVLHISAAPFLTGGLRRVLGAMTTKQRELAAARKQRHPGSVEFHFTDARSFWLLHTLSATMPVLAHLLDTPHVHPEEVYVALSRLVGELSTFAPDADPAAIPRFNYGELGEVFEHLFARVLSLLAIDSVPVYAEVPLERRPDGMFLGKIPEPRLANHEFFVAVRSNLPEPVVRERVPQLLKVAGWKHISEVVKQARHGVRAEVEWNPSASLPVKPGTCFFRLRREGPFWEEITKTSTLALYLPADADWKETWLAVYAIDPTYLR
jgi:type VI secretion system protein ImpJ